MTLGSNPQAPRVKARGETKPRVLKIEGGVLFRMAWSPDAKGIVGVGMSQEREEQEVGGMKQTVTTFNSTVQMWNAETGEMKKSLGEEKKVRIGSVAIAPNGSLIAILAELPWEGRTSPCEVRLVDASTGTLKKTIEVDGLARVVAFSPDGKSLAIGGQYIPTKLDGPFERTIRIWDLEKEKVTQEFKQELEAKEVIETGYLDGLRDLAFSQNGKLLASADADWKVRLLDAHAGKVLQTLAGHTSVVTALAFSPDGKTLVTAGFDETVRVWDAVDGQGTPDARGYKGASRGGRILP